MISINLIFGRAATKKRWNKIEKLGQLKYHSRRLPIHIFELYPLLIAFHHAKWGLFWLFLMIVRIVVVVLGILVFSSQDRDKAPHLTDELLNSNIRQAKMRGSFHTGILFLWIYAWQDLIM